MKVAVLSGGVGGSRFLLGLSQVVAPSEISVIGNVGDDLEIFGLHVSPDLDTITYSLAGRVDAERGWGRSDETWQALDTVKELSGEAWFRLGDRDIGLHLVRAEMLRAGQALSEVTSMIATRFGVEQCLLPATDDRLRTLIETPNGIFPFQTWFVERRHADPVDNVTYEGATSASAAPGVLDALAAAEVIVITPSNPFTSIHPILAVAEIRTAIETRSVPCVAVSPVIAGQAVAGPVGDMLERMVGGATPGHVATCYDGLIDALLFDRADSSASLPAGVAAASCDILMRGEAGQLRVATAALAAVR